MILDRYQKAINYALIAGGIYLAFSIYRKGIAGTAADITGAAVKAAGGALGGVVVGIGEAAGIPATSHDQCAIDMANGDNWAASFSCPAATFIKWQAAGVGANLDKLKDLL